MNNIFNQDTINIFCDASICTNYDNETLGCTGVCVTTTDKNNNINILEDYYRIIRNTTNNNSEIRAIADSIYFAIKYRPYYKNINLFSDSLICIKGLTEWIFNWSKGYKEESQLKSTSGIVKNQDIIISIINTILQEKLNINFYHQKGHVNESNIYNALDVFKRSNNINEYINIEFIRKISDFNNRVDINSRQYLMDAINSGTINDIGNTYITPINPVLNNNMSLYNNLIKHIN